MIGINTEDEWVAEELDIALGDVEEEEWLSEVLDNVLEDEGEVV